MAKNAIKWTPELERELYTPEEIEMNNLQAKLLCAIIDARQERGVSQRELEAMSGVKQSQIARLESGAASPTLDTLFKLLKPLGKTLTIVPIGTKD